MNKYSFVILIALSLVSCRRKEVVLSTVISSYEVEYTYTRYSNGEVSITLDDGTCFSSVADTMYVLGRIEFGRTFLSGHDICEDKDILLFKAEAQETDIVFNQFGEQIINNPSLKYIGIMHNPAYLYGAAFDNTYAIYDVYGEEIIPSGRYREVNLSEDTMDPETNSAEWDEGNGFPKMKNEYYFSVKDTLNQVGLLDLNCEVLLEPSSNWDFASPKYVYTFKNRIIAFYVSKGHAYRREKGIVNTQGDYIIPLKSNVQKIKMEFGGEKEFPFWIVHFDDGLKMVYNSDGKVIVPPIKCETLHVMRNCNWIRKYGGYDSNKYWIEAETTPDANGNGAMARYYELDGTLISDCYIYNRFSYDFGETRLTVAFRDGKYYVVEYDYKYNYVVKEHNLPRPASASGSWSGGYPGAWGYPQDNYSGYYGGTAPTESYSEPSRSHEHKGNTYGYKPCHMCLGSGKCSTCNGKGWYYGFGNQVLCPNCDSNHNGVCSHCHGTKKEYGLIY